MIVGNDEKFAFDAEGNRAFVAAGKDTISIVDISNREAPKIVISRSAAPERPTSTYVVTLR